MRCQQIPAARGLGCVALLLVLPPCFSDSTPDTETRLSQQVLNRLRHAAHPRDRETELRVLMASVFEKVV